MKCHGHWQVVYFFLNYSLAIVLIQYFGIKCVIGQLYGFDQQSQFSLLTGTENVSQCGNLRCVEIKVHMKQELFSGCKFVTIGSKGLAGMGIVFETLPSKKTCQEVLTPRHISRSLDYVSAVAIPAPVTTSLTVLAIAVPIPVPLGV